MTFARLKQSLSKKTRSKPKAKLVRAANGGLKNMLLFHRTSAAVEVIIFVIARKLVTPDITPTGMLLGTVAIIALVVMRKWFLPGQAK